MLFLTFDITKRQFQMVLGSQPIGDQSFDVHTHVRVERRHELYPKTWKGSGWFKINGVGGFVVLGWWWWGGFWCWGWWRSGRCILWCCGVGFGAAAAHLDWLTGPIEFGFFCETDRTFLLNSLGAVPVLSSNMMFE